MQSLDRRKFLASGALAGVAAALPANNLLAADKPSGPRNKLALATYSYWHFTRNKYPIEKVIDHAGFVIDHIIFLIDHNNLVINHIILVIDHLILVIDHIFLD